MPFGIGSQNAPATFQHLVECVLAGLTGEQCLIYLDDIIVFSSIFEEHLQRLTNVFMALRKAGLKLKPSNVFCPERSVLFRTCCICCRCLSRSSKDRSCSSYPDVKQLRQFLGLANYYRRFVPDYSKIAEPLHRLLRKVTLIVGTQHVRKLHRTQTQIDNSTNPYIS